MSYYNAIFSTFQLLIKAGILVWGRLFVAKGDILKCNVWNDTLYFTDTMGLYYIGLFALQFIVGAESLRIIVYEGAIESEIFAGVKNTFCRSALTCCSHRPQRVFHVHEVKGMDMLNQGKTSNIELKSTSPINQNESSLQVPLGRRNGDASARNALSPGGMSPNNANDLTGV